MAGHVGTVAVQICRPGCVEARRLKLQFRGVPGTQLLWGLSWERKPDPQEVQSKQKVCLFIRVA